MGLTLKFGYLLAVDSLILKLTLAFEVDFLVFLVHGPIVKLFASVVVTDIDQNEAEHNDY